MHPVVKSFTNVHVIRVYMNGQYDFSLQSKAEVLHGPWLNTLGLQNGHCPRLGQAFLTVR